MGKQKSTYRDLSLDELLKVNGGNTTGNADYGNDGMSMSLMSTRGKKFFLGDGEPNPKYDKPDTGSSGSSGAGNTGSGSGSGNSGSGSGSGNGSGNSGSGSGSGSGSSNSDGSSSSGSGSGNSGSDSGNGSSGSDTGSSGSSSSSGSNSSWSDSSDNDNDDGSDDDDDSGSGSYSSSYGSGSSNSSNSSGSTGAGNNNANGTKPPTVKPDPTNKDAEPWLHNPNPLPPPPTPEQRAKDLLLGKGSTSFGMDIEAKNILEKRKSRNSGLEHKRNLLLNNKAYRSLFDDYIKNLDRKRNMKTSQAGLDFIKNYEGFEVKPRKPTKGSKMTIGYGHEIKDGESFSSIDKKTASDLFMKDIKNIEDGINKNYKGSKSLEQNQFDALVSLGINIGRQGLMDSKIFKISQKGVKDEDEILESFNGYKYDDGKYSLGLERRRFDEAEMYLYGDYIRDYDLTLDNKME